MRLAGEGAEHREIERWRFVVSRAKNGGEPEEAQAFRIASVFEVAVSRPQRAPARRQQTEDRLRILEDEAARAVDVARAVAPLLAALRAQREAILLLSSGDTVAALRVLRESADL